jgi:hypothetical protein
MKKKTNKANKVLHIRGKKYMSISESLPSTKRSGEGTDGSSRGGTGYRRSNGGMDKSSHGGTGSGRGVTGAHDGAQRKGKSARER